MPNQFTGRISLATRFWSYVRKGDDQNCWLWRGDADKDGYGRINTGGAKGKSLRAHRASWLLHRGPISNIAKGFAWRLSAPHEWTPDTEIMVQFPEKP